MASSYQSDNPPAAAQSPRSNEPASPKKSRPLTKSQEILFIGGTFVLGVFAHLLILFDLLGAAN